MICDVFTIVKVLKEPKKLNLHNIVTNTCNGMICKKWSCIQGSKY